MLKRVLAGLSLFIAPLCWAVDTYNPSNNQLTIPSVNVSGTTYNNVVITVGNVIRVDGGTPNASFDNYNVALNQLTIPSVTVNGQTYTNVVVSVGQVVSVGGSNSASNTVMTLTGSVSQGYPISGATVVLTDANGTAMNAGTTDSMGNYSVPDISSLTAPIMISARATVGGSPVTYRSLLAQKNAQNTANVTPITDAVLVQSTGKSGALLEGAASNELPKIDMTKLITTTGKFVKGISNVLDQITAGTSSTFNPFTTSFVANGEAAADKVNDLVRVTTAITPSGVQTDITDKSNSVGSVSITDNNNASALPALPQDVLKVNPKYLSDLIANLTNAFSTPANLDGPALENLFDSQYLDNGMTKSDRLKQFRTEGRSFLLGGKFTNPKLQYCDAQNICLLSMTMKNKDQETVLDMVVKYYPALSTFLAYGNQLTYEALFYSSLKKEYDRSNNFALRSQIQFSINSYTATWNVYKAAKVTLQSGSNTPDLTYNFILKPSFCSPSIGNYYDGMPLDDGTNNCDTWKFFDKNNQSTLKTINEKIKLGRYTAKFQAWKTSNRTDNPDEAVLQITTPILTPDSLGEDGYPRVKLIQSSGSSLPYLSIDNADDYVVSGSLCISSATSPGYCQTNATRPALHTTVTQPGNVKLPSKFSAETKDGWQAGESATTFFIHVIDKAGRDIMVQKNY